MTVYVKYIICLLFVMSRILLGKSSNYMNVYLPSYKISAIFGRAYYFLL